MMRERTIPESDLGNRARDDGYLTANAIPKNIVMLFDVKNDPDELHNLAQSIGNVWMNYSIY